MPVREKITKEKIIHAFLASCFEKNAGGTSLTDIANRLGIKKASLYNHYEGRDAIVADTVRWCGEYLGRTYFIPAEISAIARSHSAPAVLKALVNRWFRLHAKAPLFQIYSFIESEKFISNDAARVAGETRGAFVNQTFIALKNLAAAGKIAAVGGDRLHVLAEFLADATNAQLEQYLTARKVEIRTNPETGIGGLFEVPPDEQQGFDAMHKIIDQFCALVRA